MSRSISGIRSGATIAAVALLFGPGAIRAQDAAVVNANTVTVKLDNAQVRVLEVATAELVAGKTTYHDAMTHWAENVGTTTSRLIIVELKEHP